MGSSEWCELIKDVFQEEEYEKFLKYLKNL